MTVPEEVGVPGGAAPSGPLLQRRYHVRLLVGPLALSAHRHGFIKSLGN